MGKVKQFNIFFRNNQAVYEVGRVVNGYVKLDLAEKSTIDSIGIHFYGYCKVKWSVSSGEDEKHYRAEETYLNRTVHFFENSRKDIQPGVHKFDFSINLPNNLPSSFEGTHGSIRYLCKAYMVRPWKIDKNVSRAFTVIRHLDLNSLPPHIHFVTYVGEAASESECFCFGYAGSVEAHFKLTKRAFVPGDYITFDSEITNNAGFSIENACAKLMAEVTYSGTSGAFFSSGYPKTKVTQDEVARVQLGTIEPRVLYRPGYLDMRVPSLPPSKIDGCRWINVIYYLLFLVPIKCGESIRIKCAITIGTLPRRPPRPVGPRYSDRGEENEYLRENSVSSQTSPPPRQQTHGAVFEDPPPAYNDIIPPPSYEECVFGVPVRPVKLPEHAHRGAEREEPEDTHLDDIDGYVPTYPFYPRYDYMSEAHPISAIAPQPAQRGQASQVPHSSQMVQLAQMTHPVQPPQLTSIPAGPQSNRI